MPRTLKSWVWEHCERSEDGLEATCKLCNEVLQTKGSTSPLNKHLIFVHGFELETHEKDVTTNKEGNVIAPKRRRTYDPSEDDTTETETDDSRIHSRSSTSNRCAQSTTSNAMETDAAGQDSNPTQLSTSHETSQVNNKSATTIRPTDVTHRSPTRSRMSIPRGRVRSVASGVRPDRPCNRDRSELINQSLTKMLAINMMPLSFVSSIEFRDFMNVVEPNYKVPCTETMKKRLVFLFEQMSAAIDAKLAATSAVAWTSDCWSSRSQDAYISITVHFIDSSWIPQSFTLATEEFSERHTATNLTSKMRKVMTQWKLDEKVSAVVTDNAQNAKNSVRALSNLLINEGVTCAAHTIQLCVTKALRIDAGSAVCEKASKVVSHFRQSNIASTALEQKQQQLGLATLKLIQSCCTRWDSIYAMISRLILNRKSVTNVLSDRTITNPATAERLEISERDWSMMESLQNLLKPLQVATTVLCGDSHAPISVVRPIIFTLRDNHYCKCSEDKPFICSMKKTLRDELSSRFDLDCSGEPNARQVASFLDPRYKDLLVELPGTRRVIRDFVLFRLCKNLSEEPSEESRETAMDFLFQVAPKRNTAETQFEMYLTEPQIGHNTHPFEWWATREKRYPTLAKIALKYLCIPASSASSERAFSTAGNIVSPKRNCLLPENVNLLVFLYQNRNLLPSLK